MIENWMGQSFDIGNYVWNARRDGNTTITHVGRILSIDTQARTAKVQWLYEPAHKTVWDDTKGHYKTVFGFIKKINHQRAGVNHVDSLVRISDEEFLTIVHRHVDQGEEGIW